MVRWKVVEGWPYEVSDDGRVRRTERASGATVGKELKVRFDRYGYKRVNLRRKGEHYRTFTIHRLVAEAFIPAPGPVEELEVNHINGVKSDSRIENLEWVTPSGNHFHAVRTGLSNRGSRSTNAKLTDEQVMEIRTRYKGEWGEQGRLALEYGVTQGLVSKIVRGDTWTHLPHTPVVSCSRTLSEAAILEMRERYDNGRATTESLAEEYGVSRSMVRRVMRQSRSAA